MPTKATTSSPTRAGQPQSPSALAVVADPITLLQNKAAASAIPPPPLTSGAATSTTTTTVPTPNSANVLPNKTPYLLSDAQFRAYQAKEEHIKALRRVVLDKRTVASSNSKKSKANSSAATSASSGGSSGTSHKKRKGVMEHAAAQAQQQQQKHRLTDAWISTPPPPTLTKVQEEKLAKTLKDSVGKDVKLKVAVDESLIGGLVVKVGSKMIDTSVRAKLNSLKNAMKEVG